MDSDTEKTKTAWSYFVRPTIDDDTEVELTASNKEQCVNKRCLLIPITVMSSAMFMKFADRSGQTELYSLVDSERPSGVSNVAVYPVYLYSCPTMKGEWCIILQLLQMGEL